MGWGHLLERVMLGGGGGGGGFDYESLKVSFKHCYSEKGYVLSVVLCFQF